MLELKHITKSYTTGDFTQVALDDLSIRFRKSEFVSILGPSGSGKTTCLNIIGGLDSYDHGDLIINGTSTKSFSDADWDAYRNNSIGFIFQNYYLIPHLTILENVEMSMTLSGVSKKEKRQNALYALEKVGLKNHVHKKPNQLSGGQQQRVAIARALSNNPDIILADEPTGALDSNTSVQIMDLLKEIADERLVIMVTHNPELAHRYSDRIIEFKDGKIINDSFPVKTSVTEKVNYQLKRTSMKFKTALSLSWKNIRTKKMRTALTAFASSIGIIGIALVLSISNGFQMQIDDFQEDSLSEFPILISQSAMNVDEDDIKEIQSNIKQKNTKSSTSSSNEITLIDSSKSSRLHKNNITNDYIDYLNEMDSSICNSIGYTRMTGMNLLRETEDGEIIPITFPIGTNTGSETGNITSMKNAGLSSYPSMKDASSNSFIEENYDLLAGSYPTKDTDVLLVVDENNEADLSSINNLGFDFEHEDKISFDKLVGIKFKVISNDDYYEQTSMGNYVPRKDYEDMYNADNSLELNLTGIVRLKEDANTGILGNGIVYSDDLVNKIIEKEQDSAIVKAQKEADYNVITMEKINEETKESLLAYLGADSAPAVVYIYPKDFDAKEQIISYLDDYNAGKAEEDCIIYSDLAQSMTDMTSGIMDAITIVLVAFATISLVVSLIMIGIITYISVMERTKEIGILRSLGARKKDITRVFNAETFIIGMASGLLGIGITYLLTIPVNHILENMTGLASIAQLNPIHAILLIIVSVTLTLIGGMIPAKMAAKRNVVNALRAD